MFFCVCVWFFFLLKSDLKSDFKKYCQVITSSSWLLRQKGKTMVTKQVEESVREHCWLIEKKWVNIHLIVVSTLEIFGIRELMHCAIWLCIETEIVSEV